MIVRIIDPPPYTLPKRRSPRCSGNSSLSTKFLLCIFLILFFPPPRRPDARVTVCASIKSISTRELIVVYLSRSRVFLARSPSSWRGRLNNCDFCLMEATSTRCSMPIDTPYLNLLRGACPVSCLRDESYIHNAKKAYLFALHVNGSGWYGGVDLTYFIFTEGTEYTVALAVTCWLTNDPFNKIAD